MSIIIQEVLLVVDAFHHLFPTHRSLIGIVEHGSRHPHPFFFVPYGQRLLGQGSVVGDLRKHRPGLVVVFAAAVAICRSVRKRVFRYRCHGLLGRCSLLGLLLRTRHGFERLFGQENATLLGRESTSRRCCVVVFLALPFGVAAGRRRRALADHLQAEFRLIAAKEVVLKGTRIRTPSGLTKAPIYSS